MDETGFRNPFRSEADAFRLLTIVAAAGAVVIAAGLLVGSRLALIIFGVMLLLSVRPVVGWFRTALGERDPAPDPAELDREQPR